MFDKKNIQGIIKGLLEKKGLFLVDITIESGDRISVYVDGNNGVSLDDCTDISSHIESQLNRDEHDYTLMVSSPGINKPFRVIDQYKKNVNKEIELVLVSGEKIKGVLQKVTANAISLAIEEGVKTGSKQKVAQPHTFEFNEIKTAKEAVSFKEI